jgi:hypothetical protein
VPSPLWAPFWAEELCKSRAKVVAVNRDGSGAQNSAGAGRTTDVGASRRTTTDGHTDGYDEGTLDDAELAEMEELDQGMRGTSFRWRRTPRHGRDLAKNESGQRLATSTSVNGRASAAITLGGCSRKKMENRTIVVV